MFSGLMSRWTMPSRCAATSPLVAAMQMSRAPASFVAPRFEREWPRPRAENASVWNAAEGRLGHPPGVQLYARDAGRCRVVPSETGAVTR